MKIKKALSNIEAWLMVPLLAGMILLVFTQIVCRYLGRSISFTEEINQQMFIWTTMLGMALAVSRGEMLGLQYLSRTGSERRARILRWIGLVAVLIFALAMTVLSFKMIWTQYQTGKVTPAMGWPIWTIGIAVPIGFLLVIIRSITNRNRP